MDPLSDVLSLLKPRSYAAGGFDVASYQSIQFHSYEGIKCYALVTGECWLSVDGVPEPVNLRAGDCFLLSSGRSFCLATDLSMAPVDFQVILAELRSGRTFSSEDESSCYLAGGHFILEGGPADVLVKSLPSIVHIRRESDRAAMRWSIERMAEELRHPQPGSGLAVQQLAYMMLLQALRLHVSDGAGGGVGWLSALADKQMSAGIACMHDDPARRWTLQELAERVGMSRSIFALRFKEKVGSTPMEYLARWRMMLAGQRLNTSEDSVSVIALSLGYESESAFGKAFRRVMGCSPREYRRGVVPAAAKERSRMHEVMGPA